MDEGIPAKAPFDLRTVDKPKPLLDAEGLDNADIAATSTSA